MKNILTLILTLNCIISFSQSANFYHNGSNASNTTINLQTNNLTEFLKTENLTLQSTSLNPMQIQFCREKLCENGNGESEDLQIDQDGFGGIHFAINNSNPYCTHSTAFQDVNNNDSLAIQLAYQGNGNNSAYTSKLVAIDVYTQTRLDSFIIKYEFGTGTCVTGIENLNPYNIKVFPNPNNGNFSIDFGSLESNNATVKIYDLSGKEVYTNFVKAINSSINLEFLNEGIYYLQFKEQNGVIYGEKLIKQQ